MRAVMKATHGIAFIPQRARSAYFLARAFGFSWLMFRIGYALYLRFGLMRYRLPARSWPEQSLNTWLERLDLAEADLYARYRRDEAPPFLFRHQDRSRYKERLGGWDRESGGPEARADELSEGILRHFSHLPAHTGNPPDWHANPFTGQVTPRDRHWSQIDDFRDGDIKVIWEPSRFSFVYDLVRAYWRNGDEEYAEFFWELVEDWRAQNPPQQGANWKCGQETSFRVMAWCFGLYGFLDASASTPQRISALAEMIAVSGHRIRANLSYALSQRNNHGISEAMGLWTIGILFPEFRSALHWRELGRRHLERLARELIYDDGSFAQHSINYHRLVLHDYLWCLRLGDLNAQPLSAALRERVAWAGNFLYQIQDSVSGRAPNYGSNDGSLILPLSDCDYQDFRPVVQATHFLSAAERCYPDGPWDEDLFWLFGPDAVHAPVNPPQRGDLQAAEGGYYTLRSEDGFAFVRCATFRHRPGDAGMLHVDIWWRGKNIAVDPGTYSYNAPFPWNTALTDTAYHNTVTVDGKDQMERVSRFVFLPWLRGHMTASLRSPSGHLAYWEGEHDGYTRLTPPVIHRRAVVQLGSEHWLILDRLHSRGEHDYRLHWLLADTPYAWDPERGRLVLETTIGRYTVEIGSSQEQDGLSLVRCDSTTPRGWRSLYYGDREPAVSICSSIHGRGADFWTLMGPNVALAESGLQNLQIVGPGWQAEVDLGSEGPARLVDRVRINGAVNDALEIQP
jgi:Heparinase II/III-like protein/Heparinase II/III N-terminus